MTSPHAPTPTPHHAFRTQGRVGTALSLDLHATLTAPWTILFGPSGCGKSTILRALAGVAPQLRTTFTRPIGRSSENLSLLPPQKRRLAYAPQQAALFPHLTALENIAFPSAIRGTARDALPELLQLLQLTPLAARRPAQLSGGERQRVAVARALAVPGAQLLLLDEPFAGVDRTLRDQLFPRLRAWLTARRLPVLSVTHDVDEALLLQAEVLRLSSGPDTAGRILAQGPAAEVLAPEIGRLRNLLSANT